MEEQSNIDGLVTLTLHQVTWHTVI